MITARQQNILEALIQEYIDTALPVGSELLFEEYHLGVSPATIRAELLTLDREGYLSQPHTSAGRIPTDRGYRFFIDRLIAEKEFAAPRTPDIEEVVAAFFETGVTRERQYSRLVKDVSSHTESFAILIDGDDLSLYKEGWNYVLREPYFSEEDVRDDFLLLLEKFERDIETLFHRFIAEAFQVYIGRENPIDRKIDEFSIIASGGKKERGEKVLALIGPKRMDYARTLSFVSRVRETLF